MDHHFFNKTFGGLLLIGIGVLFLLNQTGVIHWDLGYLLSTYWPVILIYIGLNGMLSHIRLGHGWGGSWNAFIAFIGAYFLLRNLDIGFVREMNLWQFIVPGILIILGLNMLFRGAGYEERRRAMKEARHREKEERRQARHADREERARERAERRVSRHDPRSPQQGPLPSEEEEPDPVYDPQYTRKIERDLDKAFQERVVKKLKDDPFPLVSDARPGKDGAALAEEEPCTSGERDFGGSFHAGPGCGPAPHEGPDWNAGWQHEARRRPIERSNFIGDIHLGHDYWELAPTNVSHFIGDTTIDLTKANIPDGETNINVSSFIGDVKVFVPNDIQVEVCVTASAFISDMKVMERHESGLFRSMKYDAPYYGDAEKRINLIVSMFIGDVTVKRVG